MPLKPPGPGRVPRLDRMVDKSPAQMVRTLERFGLEPDVREFERRARRAYEARLEAAIEEKGEPDADTWRAIDDDLQRSMVQTLRQQTKDAIREYRKDQLSGIATRFVWIAVMDDGSCASCEKRHGKSRTMAEWDALGAPGSAVLICRRECRCSLQPDLFE